MPDTLYRDILEKLSLKNVPVIVDASKQPLLQTLPFHPFLIKPNLHELQDLFGTVLCDSSQIFEYARRLQKMGARNVLVLEDRVRFLLPKTAPPISHLLQKEH